MNAKQFKSARESLGLSQQELASLLGLSGRQAVSNIESGLRNPSLLLAATLMLLTELPEKKSKEIQLLLRECVLHIRKSKRSVS